MLRAILSRTATPVECAPVLDSLSIQVRWRRKPRWLGTAKTKLFRVPPRRQEDPEERELMFRLSAQYKTKMKALNTFFMAEYARKESEVSVFHKSPEQIQAEWDDSNAKNNAWNAEIAKIRELRLQSQAKETEEYVLRKLAEKEERERKIRERVEAAVLEQKQQLTTFITAENIDQAIEYALANTSDHNYAIDLNGNMYKGRTGDQPEPVFQKPAGP